MARKLRWAALAAFLSLPAILYLGRPVTEGCAPKAGPCDPFPPVSASPTWRGPVFFAALAAGILLLLAATLVGLNGRADSN
jgi:hypothetical protein